MAMRKMYLCGRSEAGKTTLIQALKGEETIYDKTQYVNTWDVLIDTPGEYLERTYLRGALTVTAVDADVIVLVQQANEGGTMFPPGYSSTFAKPCIGVVTKSDLADDKQIEDAKKYLVAAGAKKVFVTSSYEGTGFEALLEYLTEQDWSLEGTAE